MQYNPVAKHSGATSLAGRSLLQQQRCSCGFHRMSDSESDHALVRHLTPEAHMVLREPLPGGGGMPGELDTDRDRPGAGAAVLSSAAWSAFLQPLASTDGQKYTKDAGRLLPDACGHFCQQLCLRTLLLWAGCRATQACGVFQCLSCSRTAAKLHGLLREAHSPLLQQVGQCCLLGAAAVPHGIRIAVGNASGQ